MNRHALRLAGFIALLTASALAAVGGDATGVPAQARWIWTPPSGAPRGSDSVTRWFRGAVTLPPDAAIRHARVVINADDECRLWVNGKSIAHKTSGWTFFESYDVTAHIVTGRNVIAVEVLDQGGSAGLIGWLALRDAAGIRIAGATDAAWKCSDHAQPGWETAAFDDGAWAGARELGPANMAPWGGKLRRMQNPMMSLTPRRATGPVTADDARSMIEEDWLYQAGEFVTPRRALDEIGWTRELAARLATMPRGPDASADLAALVPLESQLKALPPDDETPAARELYLAVRRVKRGLMFRNPLLDFDRLLLADTPPYAGAHESAHRNGYAYGRLGGSRLLVLEGLRPDGVERELLPDVNGYLMRMDLSFDASRVVYSMKPADERSFHLYEVGIDGGARRQLTDSAYDDMDPIHLPDGHLLFSTSRGNSYVRCLPSSASTVLARCDPDGRNITIISRNNEPDYTPALMPDGRVLYTRWEYTERPLWRLQKLWTMNPDGTGESAYWGNGSAYPDMLWEARAVPGTPQVMFVGVGHHNVLTGCLGLLDVRRGLQWPDGIVKVTRELDWPEVGEPDEGSPVASNPYHESGPLWSVRSPWPLGADDFLVSAARVHGGPFALFLMDVHGNRELVYTGRQTVWYAQPLRPRTPPPVIPDRVAWPKPGEAAEPGVLFSRNVLEGAGDIPAGTVRYLRVIEMDAKTYSMGFKSWRHSGPAISVIQEDGVKRILGTVPVEPDGSVSFRVPAGKALHFQLLDAQQRCVQVMRSFTGVMPGETRGCLGCHAMHSVSPGAGPTPPALRKAAVALTPPPWGAEVSIGYERFCQPVLDKYCGRCHEGNGAGRAKLDLTLRGGIDEGGIDDPALRPFKEPYLTLVGPAWGGPRPEGQGAALGLAGCLNVEVRHQYGPLAPGTALSSKSRLIELVTSGRHHDVKIEGEDLMKLIAWVDCNCVYRGDEDVRMIPDPPANVASHFPVPVKTRNAPRIDRLQPVTDPPRRPAAPAGT